MRPRASAAILEIAGAGRLYALSITHDIDLQHLSRESAHAPACALSAVLADLPALTLPMYYAGRLGEPYQKLGLHGD